MLLENERHVMNKTETDVGTSHMTKNKCTVFRNHYRPPVENFLESLNMRTRDVAGTGKICKQKTRFL